MITDFDDYMIHQAPTPINQPSVTDRNFYDRYWFNGFDMEGFFSVKGRRVEVKRRTTMGTRDKSWGVRPMGEFEDGAPSKLSTNPGVYLCRHRIIQNRTIKMNRKSLCIKSKLCG